MYSSTRVTDIPWRAAAVAGICLSAAILLSGGCVLARPAHAVVAPPPAALGAESVSFHSASGTVLRGWLVRGRPRMGAVLLLHGVGDNRTSMLGRLEFLRRAGYTVLAPDLQAHGESGGDRITFGVRESEDAAAGVRFLRDSAPGERVGVVGVSLGGAATLLGTTPLDADALVLESVYPTIREALTDRLRVWLGPLGVLAPALAPPILTVVGAEIGVDESQLRPIDRIGRVRAPLLMLSGTDDHYTTIGEARRLFARAPSPKQFWAVVGAGHQDLHVFAPGPYERLLGGFLADHLRPTAAAADSGPGGVRCGWLSRSGETEDATGERKSTEQLGTEQRACD